MRAFDKYISQGQIREMALVPNTRILVLKQWDEESWLIAPLADCTKPQTDEELQIGKYILQMWNVRTLTPYSMLGWVVGQVSDSDRQDAVDFCREYIFFGNLPEKFRYRIGKPIEDIADPRLKYRERELQKFAEVDAAELEDYL